VLKYILSIDQGTTSTRACLISASNYQFIDKIAKEFPQLYPQSGQVEHDLNEIWETVKYTIKELLNKNGLNGSEIIAIGITNQRETTCAFNRKGEPLAKAIVWQDRRTIEYCQKLKSKESIFKSKTGLTLDPYFSGTKIKWLLDNNYSVQSALKSSDLLVGTIDTFLLYKLTGVHATDASNASRTLLMNLKTGNWDDELLSILEIPKSILPEIFDSFGVFGATKNLDFLPNNIVISGILGDQQSALFGQSAIAPGQAKCTYGTGAFALTNTGDNIVYSNSGLLTTVAFQYKKKRTFALEGSCYIAGAAVQWLRDELKIISSSSEIEELAQKANFNQMENILFLPFFTGIGTPHWKSEAKGAIVGLTRDTGKNHLAAACLEGIAFSINDLFGAMEKDSGSKIISINVDGGAVNNNFLMEIQATVSNCEIIRPKITETTAYGAALAAAVGINLIGLEDIKKFWKEDRRYNPVKEKALYLDKKYNLWKETIKRLYY
jgi:glycerol kinase